MNNITRLFKCENCGEMFEAKYYFQTECMECIKEIYQLKNPVNCWRCGRWIELGDAYLDEAHGDYVCFYGCEAREYDWLAGCMEASHAAAESAL